LITKRETNRERVGELMGGEGRRIYSLMNGSASIISARGSEEQATVWPEEKDGPHLKMPVSRKPRTKSILAM